MGRNIEEKNNNKRIKKEDRSADSEHCHHHPQFIFKKRKKPKSPFRKERNESFEEGLRDDERTSDQLFIHEIMDSVVIWASFQQQKIAAVSVCVCVYFSLFLSSSNLLQILCSPASICFSHSFITIVETWAIKYATKLQSETRRQTVIIIQLSSFDKNKNDEKKKQVKNMPFAASHHRLQ